VVLGVGGAAQVLGRLGYPVLSRAVGVRARTVATLAGVAVTTTLLAVLTSPGAVVAAVVVAGALRGVLTLIHATAVTERWGTSHYGQLTGLLSGPVVVAAAAAPWVGATVATRLDGNAPMLAAMGALAALAALAGLASVPPRVDGVA
jgi:hypothetical protein